jgi:hypothetical protein
LWQRFLQPRRTAARRNQAVNRRFNVKSSLIRHLMMTLKQRQGDKCLGQAHHPQQGWLPAG